MSKAAKVTATFSVSGGTYAEDVLVLPTDLTPGEMAEFIFSELPIDTGLCHQCSDKISDPEADEITGFTVDGVEYFFDYADKEWKRYEK